MMRTVNSSCFISYNSLGLFTKLATSYLGDTQAFVECVLAFLLALGFQGRVPGRCG